LRRSTGVDGASHLIAIRMAEAGEAADLAPQPPAAVLNWVFAL